MIKPKCPNCKAVEPRVVSADQDEMRLRCVRCNRRWNIKTPRFTPRKGPSYKWSR